MHFDPVLLVVFPVFVLSVVVHECAHGLAALWCGDTTARDRGRLTLNPLPHIDLFGSILLPALLFLAHSPVLLGWAKPVPVNHGRLRSPRNDSVKVALAGPASNFLLAILFAGLTRVAPATGFFAPLGDMGIAGVVFNCALGLFNLLPIPPLDGSWVLMRFLRLRHIVVLQQFRMVGMLLVAALVSIPATSRLLLHGPIEAAVRFCLSLAGVSVEGLAL